MDKATANLLLETLMSLENANDSSKEKLDEAEKEVLECSDGTVPFMEVFERISKYTDALWDSGYRAGVERGFLACLDILREREMEEAENAASV